jgi:hypothetical protein
MADMSFKQAKELVERLELTELTLKKTLEHIEKSSKCFNISLKQQEEILNFIPTTNQKLNNMKIVVALNIGLIFGLVFGKYFL